MKQASLTAKSLFKKYSITVFVFLLAVVPATYSQVGIHTPWTWKKGSKVPLDEGDYGTVGVESASNLPYSRSGGNTFRDNNGNLWLFGGYVFQPVFFQPFYLGDLWKYNPSTNNWTYVKDGVANYGTIGVAASTNNPGVRARAASWVDNSGNFWLFGGYSHDGNLTGGVLNDLWKYEVNTNNWIWMSGSNTYNAAGNYGVQGVADSSNMPPARSGLAIFGCMEGAATCGVIIQPAIHGLG